MDRGVVKSLIAAESDQILGFAALGPETGELLTAVQVFSNVSTPVAL